MITLLMDRKQLMKLVAIITAVVLLFCALYLTRPALEKNYETGEDSYDVDSGSSIALIADMLTQIEKQAEIDEMLLAELNSGSYSFEDPLVVVDPYEISPLTALVLFTSAEPLNISVHVQGRSELADVDFTFSGYNQSHQIPVYGLYPGETNTVMLTAVAKSGLVHEIALDIQTDPLPLWLEENIIIADLVQPEKYQSGFNFLFAQKIAFDVNGVIRWFYRDSKMLQATIYGYNGNIIIAKGSYNEGDVLIYEVNMLGKIIRVYYSPYGAHHDITSIDGGNLLVTGSHGDTIEDIIYEISVESGAIINELDLKRVLPRTRTSNAPDYSTRDWLHNNAIEYYNGSIVISGKHQSAIAKISWPEGDLLWIIADHFGWTQMYHQYLLDIVDDNDFEWCYSQHAVEILPDFDNDPDTIDILLFDNGSMRFQYDKELLMAVESNTVVMPELYSRMVHFRINEKYKTIEQVWQYGKELGIQYYSAHCGDANLLDNGNRIGTFDRKTPDNIGEFNTNFIEVDINGTIVWEAYATSTNRTGSFATYRCERLPLYTSAANSLQIGVPALNFIPEVMYRDT